MLVDCPHCYTRVVPKSDGTCPACQRQVTGEHDAQPGRTTLRVAQGTRLPPVCCDCGQPTERYVAVGGKSAGEPSGWSALIVSLFSWPIGLWMFLRGLERTSVVQVRVPQCWQCGRGGRPKPRYVDFPNARMTFVVHRKLKETVASQEGRAI